MIYIVCEPATNCKNVHEEYRFINNYLFDYNKVFDTEHEVLDQLNAFRFII